MESFKSENLSDTDDLNMGYDTKNSTLNNKRVMMRKKFGLW